MVPSLPVYLKAFDKRLYNTCSILGGSNHNVKGLSGKLIWRSISFLLRKNSKFIKYSKGLNERIKSQIAQRKFIFPYPRPIQDYLKALKQAGFKCIKPYYKCFKIKYSDWLKFLRVKRLQAGILPEVGGKDPSPEEEKDRDTLISMAAKKLFKELETLNPLADDKTLQGEWVYIFTTKER